MKTWQAWWIELKELAGETGCPLYEPEQYREYYLDGDSPERVIHDEIGYEIRSNTERNESV